MSAVLYNVSPRPLFALEVALGATVISECMGQFIVEATALEWLGRSVKKSPKNTQRSDSTSRTAPHWSFQVV